MSLKVSHRIAANLLAPSSSLAGLPQAPEASFRSVASEWVTPHFLRLPETLGESLQVFGVAAFACVLAFLIVLNHFKAPPKKASPGSRGKLCASFWIPADAGKSLETLRKPQPSKDS